MTGPGISFMYKNETKQESDMFSSIPDFLREIFFFFFLQKFIFNPNRFRWLEPRRNLKQKQRFIVR